MHKTEAELQAILAAKEEKLRLKAQRQNQQAENLQRKQELREAHKYAKAVGRTVGWRLCKLKPLSLLSSRKKSLAGMKRARAGTDGDSDAEDPGAPPEAVGTNQNEEDEDDAEYFRQAVGEEPDEGVCRAVLVIPGAPYFLRTLTISLPTDMFPRVGKRRRMGRPPGKKQRGKEQRPGSGRGQRGNWRPLKPKGRFQGVKTKLGPRARRQDTGRPSRT